jgi:hypothetical protein
MSKTHKHHHGVNPPQVLLDVILKPVPSKHPNAKDGLLYAHITGDFHESRARPDQPNRIHKGVDFNYNCNQTGINLKRPKFHSPIDGVMINNPMESKERTISILDNKGFIHKFMHADAIYVKKGQKISAGQELGEMGGYVNGSPNGAKHVHYEIRKKSSNIEVDPNDFWRPRTAELKVLFEQQKTGKLSNPINTTKDVTSTNSKNEPPLPKDVKSAPLPQTTQIKPAVQNQAIPSADKPDVKIGIRFNKLNPEEYQSKVWDFLVQKEGFKTKAYSSGKSIAIGVGYDLLQHQNSDINQLLKKTGLPPLTQEQKNLLNEARQKSCSIERRQEIAANLDLKIPENAVKKLFVNSLSEYENRLDKLIRPHAIPESTERIALLSMTYHGRLQNYKVGPQVLNDIFTGLNHGDRQEVWNVIRLGVPKTQPELQKGFYNRANNEAALFSPFDRNVEQAKPHELKKYATVVQNQLGQHSKVDQLFGAISEKTVPIYNQAIGFIKSATAGITSFFKDEKAVEAKPTELNAAAQKSAIAAENERLDAKNKQIEEAKQRFSIAQAKYTDATAQAEKAQQEMLTASQQVNQMVIGSSMPIQGDSNSQIIQIPPTTTGKSR